MRLPASTLRLFPGYDRHRLASPASRPFVIVRLLEEGDRADLECLGPTVAEAEVRAVVERRGARQLSRRSRAFWSLVLGAAPAGADEPSGDELWPL